MKRIAIALCAICLCVLFCIPAFATPAVNPSPTEVGGSLTANQVMRLAEASKAECAFLSASSFNSGSLGVMEPVMITAVEVADQFTYYVYIGTPSAKVDTIPEEWEQSGALVNVGVTYVYKCGYNFGSTGGLGYWSYMYASNKSVQLAPNERIVYVFKGMGIGLNSSYPYPSIDTIGKGFVAPSRWINAMSAFDGNLSPELTRAEYNLGYADGQAEGYSGGYSAGFSYAERKYKDFGEDKYKEGYAHGVTAGYNQAIDDVGAGNNVAYTLDVPAIITAIPVACKALINNAFGFEIFGINVAGLLSALVVVGIILWAVNKAVKK